MAAAQTPTPSPSSGAGAHPDQAAGPSSIPSRSPDFGFDQTIPRHWFGGNRLASHMANGVNLVFPLGERFFVRSVRRYRERLTDPRLKRQIRGFSGQEGRHAYAHEAFFQILEGQGFRLGTFLKWYERIAYRVLEPLAPPLLRLSATVALEHYTALMADNALRHRLLDAAHPAVRKLLLWHAAEEIEHKAVAFDVLRSVNPSYLLRMAGLMVATLTLIGFWVVATVMLLWQDRSPSARSVWKEFSRVRRRNPLGRRVFLRGIREYVHRDFHPWDHDNLELAREFLTAEGLA